MNEDILYDTIKNNEDIKYNKDKPLWFMKWQQKFYHSKEWVRLRESIINNIKAMNHGMVISDVSHELITTTIIVDHIKPVTIYNYMDYDITLNPDNLQVMSKEEHYQKHYGHDDEDINISKSYDEILNDLIPK